MNKTACKKSAKVKIINAFLVLLIIGTLLFEANLLTRAQNAAVPPAEPTQEAESPERDKSDKCIEHMKTFMAAKKVDFAAFMNEHFRSGSPTSDLADAAIAKYRQYRTEVNAEMLTFSPEANKVIQVAINENPKCAAAVTEDFNLMRSAIRQHIVQNAYAKKSTRLVDKYKQINNELKNLNFTIAQTYGYFAALSQKLPCYTEECTQK